MLLPALIAVSAVGLGLLFGLAPAGAGRVVGPLRTFALTAALSVAGTHLLPEAFAELGAVGLAVFALGLSLPSLVRVAENVVAAKRAPRANAALEFGYAGLLIHHVADGLGLGAYGGGGHSDHGHGHGHGHAHADVLVALAVHTVPLVAVITLAYRSAGGVRAAVTRSGGLAVASLVGIAISSAVSPEQAERFEAWVAAGVAGLLVHVVTHDLERDLPRSAPARLLDVAAAAAGVLVSLAAAAELDPGAMGSGTQRVLDVVFYLSPPLALAFALAAALDTWLGRQPRGGCVREPLRLFSLRRSLSLREHPGLLSGTAPRPGYVALVLASAVGFDAIILSLWLSGPGVELARLLGVVLLAAAGALLLPAPTAPTKPLAALPARGLLANFADSVARASPWLFTSVLLAAMLDASLSPQALHSSSPWLLLVILSALALPAQVEAAAAVPVLAVLVQKGLPVGAALAAWLAFAAPGERGLVALLRRRAPGKIVPLLLVTVSVAAAVGYCAQLSGLSFAPIGASVAADTFGLPAAVLLGVPVVYVIWKDGLRGWLSTVFLHEHHHTHAPAHEPAATPP